MLKPIITLDDFKGGMTLNEKLGREDQFFSGYGTDFYSRPGYIAQRPGFTQMTLSASADIGVNFQAITYATENNLSYFGGENGTIYEKDTSISLKVAHASAQTGAIRSFAEYKGFLYYAQDTTIGRSDVVNATPTYTDNWQTGLNNTTYKPMQISGDNNLYIGNGQYLSKFDGTTFTAQALDLQSGWTIRALANFGIPYVAIAGNFTAGISGDRTYGSKIFLWDRLSSTWNDEVEIPEDGIYSMIYTNGYLWVWAGGSSISLYVIPVGSRTATKLWKLENDDPSAYQNYVWPNAVTYEHGRILFGVSGHTSASDVNTPGVYSFNPSPNNLEWNVDHTSTAYSGLVEIKSLGTGVTFGSNANYVPILYFSVDNGTAENTYVENTTDPSLSLYGSDCVIETSYYDAPAGQKILIEGIGLDFLPRTGGTITLDYKKDADTSWTNIRNLYQTNSTVGFYNVKAIEAYTLKFRITISSGVDAQWFIKRLWATGQVMDDQR